MPYTSIADFAAALRQGRLLDPAQLEQLAHMPAASGDPRALARELVRQGWLTPYQVNELFLGRGDALTLGSYVLLEKLGEGGMGVVFKARHHKLGRVVALKIIRPEHLAKPEAVRRFRREMRAVAQLDHPNLVRAYDADEIEGNHFIAMEYVDGVTLAHRVKDHGPLPLAQACDCIRQAALGLQHAFERGLIHRDVKPSNLLLSPIGCRPSAACQIAPDSGPTADSREPMAVVKLLDLGLARFALGGDAANSSMELTREGMAVGTADFMAPEQGENARTVDIRADIYSLGCTLYFLLTGRPPFPGGSLVDKMLRHRYDTPPALAVLRPGLPPRLIEVARRLLAKEPADRHQTPADVAAALGELLRAGGLTTTPLDASLKSPVVDARADTPDVFRDIDADTPPQARSTPSRRLRRPYAIAGIGLAVLAAVLLILLFRNGPEDEGTPNEPPARTPSPMARLQQEDIPRERQFLGQPGELVGVFGEPVRRHWGPAWCVAFHPDGNRLASGGGDRAVRLWHASSGEEVAVLHEQDIGAYCILFSPDGKILATGGRDGRIRLWDTDRIGTPGLSSFRVALSHHGGAINGLAFNSTGKLLASASADQTICLWDLTTNRRPDVLKTKSILRGVAISPDDKWLAAAGEDGTVLLWDLPTRQPRATISGKQVVCSVAFSPDGTSLAAGSYDGLVRLWDVTALGGATAPNPRGLLQGPAGKVVNLAFSGDGKTLVTSASTLVQVWDLATARGAKPAAPRQVIKGHPSEISSVALSLDGGCVASATDISVRLWDPATGKERAPLKGSLKALQTVAVAPDGATLAASGPEQRVIVWDVATGNERMASLPLEHICTSLAFSPDSKLLASGTANGGVKLWDPATGTLQAALKLRCSRPARILFVEEGRAFAAVAVNGGAAGLTNDFLLWDVRERRERGARPDIPGSFAWANVSSDGRALALRLTDNTLQLWDLAANREGKSWKTDPLAASAMLFAPDGKTLALGAQGRVVLRDLAGGESRVLHTTHKDWVRSLSFSPDGRLLASTDNVGRVVVWDRVANRRVKEWQFPGPVFDVAFAADGRHLATANANGTSFVLRLW